MSAILSKRHSRNNSAGGVAPEKSQQKIAQHIQNLRANLTPLEKQEESLNTIDVVVGRPTEKLIPRELQRNKKCCKKNHEE